MILSQLTMNTLNILQFEWNKFFKFYSEEQGEITWICWFQLSE